MAGERNQKSDLEVGSDALRLITEAMDLLHGRGIIPEAAANLGLAQQQVRNFVRLEKSKLPEAD